MMSYFTNEQLDLKINKGKNIKQSSTKTKHCCSVVNNKIKIIRHWDKNPSSKTTEFLNKKFKMGMDKGIRMVLILVRKEVDQTFQSHR